MKSFDARFLAFAALVLSGCASLSHRPPLLSPPLPGIPKNRVASCPHWRWVTLKPEGIEQCPVPKSGTWTVRPAFPPGRTTPAPRLGKTDASAFAVRKARQEKLSRFCLYESRTRGNMGKVIRDLYQTVDPSRIYPDCAMMGSLAGPGLAEQTWEDLQSHLFSQVERSPHPGEGERSRLAILDTLPEKLWEDRDKEANTETVGKDSTSPHGLFLAHLGSRLVCDDAGESNASCASKVTARLALPLRTFDPRVPPSDEEKVEGEKVGGYFGRVSDLTDAIEKDLAEPRKPDEHLVLNLSLGWEGTDAELTGPVDEMPVLVQALYHILTEAACQGVLVIAAAGNRVGGSGPETGMLLPAAWADRAAECGGDPESQPRLIYAVGGVDSEGKPLSNARENGMPELVAFADHAVVETFTPGEPTKTYTGSSVAAAVASAVAAAVWNKHPDWTARQVMDTLYNTGCELTYKADVVAKPPLGSSPGGPQLASSWGPDLTLAQTSPLSFGPAHRVRRISLARALGQASTSQHRLASLTAQQSCLSLGKPKLDIHLDGKYKVDGSSYQPTSKLTQGDCAGREIEVWTNQTPGGEFDDELVSALCSIGERKAAMEDPWTGPQPPDLPCPNCTLEPQGTGGDGVVDGADSYCTLYIEIDTDWPTALPLSNPTLLFGDTAWQLSYSDLTLSSTPDPSSDEVVLNPGQTMTVANIPGDCVLGAERIMLLFTTDEGLIENPVLVANRKGMQAVFSALPATSR